MTTKIPHKHAELFRELAEDGEAWRNWVSRKIDGQGFYTPSSLLDLLSAMNYNLEIERKPTPAHFTKIGDKLVPAPCREPLKIGQDYFFAGEDGVSPEEWHDDSYDHRFLDIGRIHLTREAAQAHVDAEKMVNTTLVDENGNKINP